MSVQIRLARPDEYAAIGELSATVYVEDGLVPAGHAYLSNLAAAADRAAGAELLVAVVGAAVDGSAVIGSVTFVPFGSPYTEIAGPGEVEIRMLVVAAKARGQGLGEALVRAALERAAALGATRMRLSTQPNMVGAHPIYRRLGFVRTPERDWVPAPGVDLLTYVLPLG
jgi:ribosomal protein S18 acetylase RimI-like enzyme